MPELIIKYYLNQHKMLNIERNISTDLFFSCNFYSSGGNLRKNRDKLVNTTSVEQIRLKYLEFIRNYWLKNSAI